MMTKISVTLRNCTLLLVFLGGSAIADALGLSDPRQLVDAYVRTVGDTEGDETFMYANVVVMAMVPGEKGRKLVGLEAVGVSRFYPIEGGYQRPHREVGLYTDLATGEVLSSWSNPFHVTGMKPPSCSIVSQFGPSSKTKQKLPCQKSVAGLALAHGCRG